MAESETGQLSEKELRDLKRMQIVKDALDRLKRRGIDADIVICPVCKSHRVIDLTSYSDLGYIGSFHPAMYCLDCGWYSRIKIVMSNRPEPNAVLDDLHEAFSGLLEVTEGLPEEEFL
ncbi:MAG: hypothetical protein RTU92_00785 [Candidatus Thorarchaeota archaeon]